MTERANDLPVSWDGRRIVWNGWQDPLPIFICPPPKPVPCSSCGSLAERSVNSGEVWSDPAEGLRPFRRAKTYGEAAANQRAAARGVIVLNLLVFRCPDCRLDEVLSSGSFVNDAPEEYWTLDETDYGAAGSGLAQESLF